MGTVDIDKDELAKAYLTYYTLLMEQQLGDEQISVKHIDSGNVLRRLIGVSGDRFYGSAFRLDSDTVDITSTTFSSISAIILPMDFKPAHCKMLLLLACDMKNDTSTVKTMVQIKDADTLEILATVETDGGTTRKCYFAEVDLTPYSGTRRLSIEAKVTASSTGTIYWSSMLYVMYEVI